MTKTVTLQQAAYDWLVYDNQVLDADWRSVSPCLIMSHAQHGRPLQQATTVRLIASPTALWVRFDCADNDAWATLTEHDSPLYTEEVVELFIAPGEQTPATYFELQTNPLNVQFDGIIQNPDEHRSTMTLDLQWNPIWHSWTRVDPAGWVSVWALPWQIFGREHGLGSWRANFYRIDRERNGSGIETSAWSPTVREPVDFHVPSQFGVLTIVS